MKVRRYGFLLGWIFLWIIFSSISVQSEEKDISQVRKILEEGGVKFVEAINKGDAAAAAALYTDDAILMPPNSEMIKGKSAIQEFWNTSIQMGIKNVSTTVVDIQVSGDLAYRIGKYTLTVQPQDHPAVTDSGKFLDIWKRQADGSWKIQVDTWNNDTPAHHGQQ